MVGVEAESYTGYITSRSGSGIILSADGYIITNSHVIEGCDSISVTLDSGNKYQWFSRTVIRVCSPSVISVAAAIVLQNK